MSVDVCTLVNFALLEALSPERSFSPTCLWLAPKNGEELLGRIKADRGRVVAVGSGSGLRSHA